MAAAAHSSPPPVRYVPQFELSCASVKDSIAKRFEEYFSTKSISPPPEVELSDRNWCAIQLFDIANWELEHRHNHLEALNTCRLSFYLLSKVPRPECLPTWEDVKKHFNDCAPGTPAKVGFQCAAALQVEDALRLGGLTESDEERNVVLARSQLAKLASLHDKPISLSALDALCSLLTYNLGPLEETELLQEVLDIIVKIMKDDGSALPTTKVKKCIEVCALILERWTLLYEQGYVLASDFHDKYALKDLIDYFQLLNTKGNPDIAAWGAFALERLKKIDAPFGVVRVLSWVEEVLKKAAITAAGIHEAQTAKLASRAKDVSLEVAGLVAKTRYLAPGRKWAKNLEEILKIVEDAKSDYKVLKHIQKMMTETLDSDISHSFVYFCVQILVEIILESNDEEVQNLGFYNGELLSIQLFSERVLESMTDKVISPKSKPRKFLNKVRANLPGCKTKKDIWSSPRLILALTSSLHKLTRSGNSRVKEAAANNLEQIEKHLGSDEYAAVSKIYENRPKKAHIQERYYKFLIKALRKVAESAPAERVANAQARTYNHFRCARPDFVGRVEILQSLSEAFVDNLDEYSGPLTFPLRRRSLFGIGGQGKTETALKFANENLSKFSFVWWIDCKTLDTRNKSYLSFPKGFEMSDSPAEIFKAPNEDFDKFIEQINQALETGEFTKPWLLIFDNFDDPKLKLKLPSRGGCALVTSRRRNIFNDPNENIFLCPLSEKEIKLLYDFYQCRGQVAEFIKLSEEVRGHALLLNQMAKSLSRSVRLTAKTYLAKIEDSGLGALIDTLPNDDRYERCIDDAMSLERLSFGKDEWDWLVYCSTLGPGPISLDQMDEWLQSRGVDQDKFEVLGDKIVKSLLNRSLLEFNFNEGLMSLHPIHVALIHQLNQKRCKDEPRGNVSQSLESRMGRVEFVDV